MHVSLNQSSVRRDLAAPKTKDSAMRRYFYNSLASYLSLYVRPQDEVVEIGPRSDSLGKQFAKYRAVSSVEDAKSVDQPARDYVLLNGTIHYERDIQEMLNRLRECLEGSARVLFVYYSMLWKPLAWLRIKGWRAQSHARTELDRS